MAFVPGAPERVVPALPTRRDQHIFALRRFGSFLN